MVINYEHLINDLFIQLSEYTNYLNDNGIPELLGADINKNIDPAIKIKKDRYFSVNPNLDSPFPPELDDLARLHFLVRSRKVITILEFGLGKSTAVFDDALQKNEKEDGGWIQENLRRANPYRCFSVDNYPKWIEQVKKDFNLEKVDYHLADLEMTTFNDKICTLYSSLPNICPDLIYLDGPDQFSAEGTVRGITTETIDRVPMAADILALEHFLLPGTLIVVDGRSANARFLKCNLQRDWLYDYSATFDQHFFELVEQPLGVFNKSQIEFCLGERYFERLSLLSKKI